MQPLSAALPQNLLNRAVVTLLFSSCLLFFWGEILTAAAATPIVTQENSPALCRMAPSAVKFFDDGDRAALIAATKSQLEWATMQPWNRTLSFGKDKILCTYIARSLETFLRYLQKKPSAKQLNHYIRTHFDIYQVCPPTKHSCKGRDGKMLVTAYYEPTFAGSKEQSKTAHWPIYRLPQKRTAPMPTRAEIENKALFAGEELAWLNDPLDAYLLHVQGSGKIRFTDGTTRAVRYAGNNGHPYMSLGKLFVDRNIMPIEKVNNISIRKWLTEHPEKREEMLQHNPRFIFFCWGDEQNPKGSNGVALTPGRSIAIDPSILPTGSIGFLQSRMPLQAEGEQQIHRKPLHRFVFPQDKGAAIKGSRRVDLFLGAGKDAEYAANIMREQGKLYFLFLQGTPVSKEKRCQ